VPRPRLTARLDEGLATARRCLRFRGRVHREPPVCAGLPGRRGARAAGRAAADVPARYRPRPATAMPPAVGRAGPSQPAGPSFRIRPGGAHQDQPEPKPFVQRLYQPQAGNEPGLLAGHVQLGGQQDIRPGRGHPAGVFAGISAIGGVPLSACRRSASLPLRTFYAGGCQNGRQVAQVPAGPGTAPRLPSPDGNTILPERSVVHAPVPVTPRRGRRCRG